jgi:hypothetical protein
MWLLSRLSDSLSQTLDVFVRRRHRYLVTDNAGYSVYLNDVQ